MEAPSEGQRGYHPRHATESKADMRKLKANKQFFRTNSDPLAIVSDPRTKRRASLALRQVIVSGTETALQERTGGLVQDFLRRDVEASRLLASTDSSGSEDEDRPVLSEATASTDMSSRQRTHIFADRSFWRRARQIACFEYVAEQMRSSVREPCSIEIKAFAGCPEGLGAPRPMTRQEQGYFDLGRFLEPKRRAAGAGESRTLLPMLQLPSMSEEMPTNLTRTALSFESSMPVPLEKVAEPFLRPWQSQVRTETGLPEPEAEKDSATMRYIRVCNATGVVPTAAVLEMVRQSAIYSGGELLLDDELLAMSSLIGHLSSIREVVLAGSTKLSDSALQSFLQQLFGRPAMDSLEKLDLARCRGAGPKAVSTLVALLVAA
eukprot:g7911.t1